MSSIFAAILLIGPLIFFHELGHLVGEVIEEEHFAGGYMKLMANDEGMRVKDAAVELIAKFLSGSKTLA